MSDNLDITISSNLERAVAGNEQGQSSQAARARRPRSVLRSLAAKCVLVMVATSVALLACELVLRVFVEQETKRLAVYDEDLGWRGKPHGEGMYVRHKDNIRVPYRYNNIGFRDEDLKEKPVGGTRVLLLGDSFSEGLEVKYEDVFHERLEQQLQDKHGTETEVVMLGSQGYSSAQELLAFRKFQAKVAPDAVLTIFYTGNDYEDNLRSKFAYLDEAGSLVLPQNQDSQLRRRYLTAKRWLYESSHLVFLLKNRLESVTPVRLSEGSKAATPRSDQYKNQITTELVRRIKNEAEEAGAAFGLVIIPSREELENKNDNAVSTLVEVCAANSIDCLNLSHLLKSQHFFQTDIHLNESGHAIVAEQLELFLDEISGGNQN